MSEFDKQRVENALWVLEQYKDELIGIAEESENITSFDFKRAMSILRVIKEELR